MKINYINKEFIKKLVKGKLMPLVLTATIGASVTGCSINVIKNNDYISTVNSIDSQKILRDFQANNFDKIRTFDYLDDKLCKLGNIAVLRYGKKQMKN